MAENIKFSIVFRTSCYLNRILPFYCNILTVMSFLKFFVVCALYFVLRAACCVLGGCSGASVICGPHRQLSVVMMSGDGEW